MGFKTLMFLIVIIIMSLFFVQNLNSISLVFLGFNSLSLPLSFWIIFALFAGILSSLIIQVLSNNPTPKVQSNQSFSKKIPDNPPPSPKYNKKYNQNLEQPSFADKTQFESEKQTFSSPPIYEKNSLPNNLSDEFDSDFDFDDMPDDINEDNINEDNQLLEETNQTNYAANNIDINPKLETDNIPSSEKKIETELTSSSSEDIPLEKILKPREASIYSYQSREKTDIKPKLSTPKVNKQKLPLPNNNGNNNYKDGVYDAPYRVITPAYNDNQEEIYNDFEDEDWEF